MDVYIGIVACAKDKYLLHLIHTLYNHIKINHTGLKFNIDSRDDARIY